MMFPFNLQLECDMLRKYWQFIRSANKDRHVWYISGYSFWCIEIYGKSLHSFPSLYHTYILPFCHFTSKRNHEIYSKPASLSTKNTHHGRVWVVDFDSIKMKQRNYFPFISVDDLWPHVNRDPFLTPLEGILLFADGGGWLCYSGKEKGSLILLGFNDREKEKWCSSIDFV